MPLECRNDRLLKVRKINTLDNLWKELFINMGNIRAPITLDEKESDVFLNELWYIPNSAKKHIKKLRSILKSEWFKIILDPKKHKSHYDGNEKTITVGVKNHSDDTSYFKLANLNEKLDEKYVIWAMFAHECSHHVVYKCHDYNEMWQLTNMFISYVRNSNKTLTKLSHWYECWDKIKEDLTELIRMYINSPKQLKNHLRFLSTTWDISVLNEYNLLRISKKNSKIIFKLISTVVDKYIK